jgi:DeoR/GlpR family transcriptional regulator of sugar metabolism
MPDTLFLEERRRAILDQLERQGRVTVRELSDAWQVSAVTIRQDLRALEEAGLLERTYGGAVSPQTMPVLNEPSFNVRREKNRAQKQAIAAAAAELIEEGHSVALDSSSTVCAMAQYVKQFSKLTLVTNGIMLAQSFVDKPEIQVLMPGGRLRRDSISLVGAPETLPEINLNIGFFSARGLAEGIGASELDLDEVQVKQALMRRCVRRVLLVDESKWGQVAPYTLVAPDQIERVITTRAAPSALVAYFRDLGTEVTMVDF